MDLKRFYSLNFLGRLFLSAIFINAIPGKITNFSAQAEYISNRGFPESVSMIMMVVSIALLFSGESILVTWIFLWQLIILQLKKGFLRLLQVEEVLNEKLL